MGKTGDSEARKAAEYEETGLTPDQIKEIDVLYAMKCKEVASLEKAMQERWIPCSEKLPNESGTYIISANDGHINHVSFTKWMPRFSTWALSGCRSYWKVKAWMPLPEPYRPEEDER